MTIAEIIQKAYPEADQEFIDHVLWERTPFPFAPMTPKDLYKAARTCVRAKNNKRRLCDHCNNEVREGYQCEQCKRSLES